VESASRIRVVLFVLVEFKQNGRSEDDESLAGLTQNTFLKAPLEPCFDLFSGLLEGDCNVGDGSNNTSNNTIFI
jgi:hypothetical protein